MYKKIFSLSILIIFFLSTGLGCKGLSSEQQTAIKPVTLNYWTVYNNVAELQRLALEYQKLHSYVTINIRQLRFEEYQDKFLTALADDVGPDIISLHVRDLPKHIVRLSASPASAKVATIQVKDGFNKETIVTTQQNTMPSVTIVKNRYLQTVAEDVIFNGKIYGLPLTVDTLGMYYNKDLLDAAGIASPPTTWGEFLPAVKQATKLDPGNPAAILQSGVALGTGTNIDNAADIYALLLLQKGIKVMENGNITFTKVPDRAQTPPALESLRFYTDFARPEKDAYSWNESMGNAFEEFVRGKSVFYFGFGFDLDRIKARAPQMNLAVAPMIKLNPENSMNVANYWVETVPKKSKHQNEAWDFIRFISTPENLKSYSAKAHVPSALREHNKDQRSEENPLSPFALQVLQAENWYRGKDYAAGKTAFQNLITDYLKPYPPEIEPQDRDINIITNTARLLQQTL